MFRPTLSITAEGAKHQTIPPGHLWVSEEGSEMGSNTENMIITLSHVSVLIQQMVSLLPVFPQVYF